MSGLLGLLVPGLLMLISLGLGRVEANLMRHTLRSSDVADFLAQASLSDMHRLACEGMPSAIEDLHRRQLQRIEPSLEAVYQATTIRPRHPVVDSLRAGGAAV